MCIPDDVGTQHDFLKLSEHSSSFVSGTMRHSPGQFLPLGLVRLCVTAWS